MTPERWQQVKEIFHAALDRAPAERDSFLEEACAGDAEARQEVESLISAHEQPGEFLEAPAYAVAAETLVGGREHLAPGARLGNYRVLSRLGSGGMGDVYLAEDARLGRKVALKLLPASFNADAERVRRFEQEARSASALNHPNVCTIHEVGETEDGHRFIVMEYVDGVTLRALLASRRPSLAEALDVAAQVAAALASAHERRIVHRDIKPDNVMIRGDGLVKVLDFGLAKLVERGTLSDAGASALESARTGSGLVMGTVSYMSPEQARGKEVDERADVWSLGVVIHEMVTGAAPFAGESHADVIVSLLEREPPPLSESRADVPAELQRIVRKALRKDREERYQTVRDMALDLKSLRRELDPEAALERSAAPLTAAEAKPSDNGARAAAAATAHVQAASTRETQARASAAHTVAAAGRGRKVWVVLGVVAAVVVCAALLWKLFVGRGEARLADTAFRRTNVTKLTTNGNARMGAVSPDGRLVAYMQSDGEGQSLWVRQVSTAGNVPLLPAATAVGYLALTFSPDGQYVYYVAADARTPPTLYRVPAVGQGAAVKVLDEVYSAPGFSPDGRRIAFVRYDQAGAEASLMVARLDGSEARTLLARRSPEGFGSWPGPAWSPDGKQIAVAFQNADAEGTFYNVAAVSVDDGAQRLLTSGRWNLIEQTVWLPDGSGVLTNAKDNDESFFQVWLLPYPSGEPRKLTGDLSDYRGVSLSADARALVTTQAQSLSNVWVAPARAPERAAPVTSGGGRYFDLAWTPDGKILYASDASGSADIWEMNPDGTGQRQITVGEMRNYGPHATSDGRHIVFHSNRSGSWQIWRTNRDGSDARQLTASAGDANFPQATPDGRWVVYQAPADDLFLTVWRVSFDGGRPTRLTDRISLRPAVSPDGRFIACWQNLGSADSPPPDNASAAWVIAIIPVDGGPPVKTFAVTPDAANWDNKLAWTADGKAVTYFRYQGGVHNVWSQPLDGGPARRLTNFVSEQVFSHVWSRDGRLALSRGVLTGDIVRIDDVR